MTTFDSINLVTDLIFGLVMLVYGFAAGLFVAGWVLRRCTSPRPSPQRGEGEERTGHQRRQDKTRISRINTKGEPDEQSGK